MKDYKDPIINAASEILSEAAKPKALRLDRMTVDEINKAIKQGKTTQKEVKAWIRSIKWDEATLKESSEERISYDEALGNVAYQVGGEHTTDALLHAYAAALSFAFSLEDAGKVYNDLKHTMTTVAPLGESTVAEEASDGIEHSFDKSVLDKLITVSLKGRSTPDYRVTVDMTSPHSSLALDAARTALRLSNPGMRVVTRFRLGNDNPASKDYETTSGIRKGDAQRADIYLTTQRPPGY